MSVVKILACLNSQEESLGTLIVASAFEVSTVLQDGVDPIERIVKLVPPPVGIEKREDVNTHNGVQPGSPVVEVDLKNVVGIAVLQHRIHDSRLRGGVDIWGNRETD